VRLPVVFIFAGVGLQKSALLRRGAGDGYESTEQLRRRHSPFPVDPLDLPRDAATFSGIIKNYAKRVHSMVPNIRFSGLSDARTIADLHRMHWGIHGSILASLKDATAAALVIDNHDVSSELLMEYVDAAGGASWWA
jgi:hypothetical protein